MGLIYCTGGDDSKDALPHYGNRAMLSSRAAILTVLIVFLISSAGMVLVFAQFPDLDEYVCLCVVSTPEQRTPDQLNQ